MRIRSIFAALLVLSLAVTPAAARAAYAVKDGRTGTSHGEMAAQAKMAAMPDCHRMMAEQAGHKPSPAKSDTHKNCPDCDKRGPCAADFCQLKCFKVLGAALTEGRATRMVAQQFDLPAPTALEPVSYEPRTPPPRT
jgi:hypothetical protein